MSSRPNKIFENRTTDGDSTVFTHEGGDAVLYVWGTFDSCTVTFNHSPDGTTYFTETALTYTAANEGDILTLRQGVKYKATVSSAGGSTDINVTLT
jgi:hypothetical protein